MKLNRSHAFIAISSVALLIVLLIQVNWIFKTAQVKEELFNEKANMVLARTTEELNKDQVACGKIQECVDNSGGSTSKVGDTEARKIDSLFTHYMKVYNISLDYSYVVAKSPSYLVMDGTGFGNCTYNQPINQSGTQLKLILPDKTKFIIAEMGPMFITSVLLILIVMVLFWRTVLSLLKEKKIADHTRDFLNNMTHEFKTPLTNIALAGKMIQKDHSIEQGEKLKHYSGIILEENDKLRLQVEQMLSMTALERGEIPLQKTEVDFHGLIHEAVKRIKLPLEHKHGKLELRLHANQFVINGDTTHLINMITNLLDNGIKYSADEPILTIETTNQASYLTMVITDNGIGIDKEYQKKVFDPFFRVPTGDLHDVKGFGLGLSYIKKIVELHGGKVELQSEKGKGTRFILQLPHA